MVGLVRVRTSRVKIPKATDMKIVYVSKKLEKAPTQVLMVT